MPLGRGRVGAGQQQAPVGVQRAAGPQLLPVDEVAVARRGARSSAATPGRTRPRARRSPGPRSRRPGSPAGAGAAARRCPPRAGWRRRGGSRRTRAPAGARRARPAPGTGRPARASGIPPPHSAGQCGTAYPAARSSPNHHCWNATNSASRHPGLRLPPVRRDVRAAPVADLTPGTRSSSPADEVMPTPPSASESRSPAAPAAGRGARRVSMVARSAAKPACIGPAEGLRQVHAGDPLGAAQRLGGLGRQPLASRRASCRSSSAGHHPGGEAELNRGGGRDAVPGVEVLARPQDRGEQRPERRSPVACHQADARRAGRPGTPARR